MRAQLREDWVVRATQAMVLLNALAFTRPALSLLLPANFHRIHPSPFVAHSCGHVPLYHNDKACPARCATATQLHAAAKSDSTKEPSSTASKNKSSRGVYARPSAAIERGSGFFIPGLEGPRVRLLFGIAVILLSGLNHFLLEDESSSFSSSSLFDVPERVALVSALLLLLQSAIEFGKETTGAVIMRNDAPTTLDNVEDLLQSWHPNNNELSTTHEYRDKVQWAAASYMALTPATNLWLLDSDCILYRLGTFQPSSLTPESEKDGVVAALETLNKSRGGRVSLPMTHPVVQSFGLPLSSETRIVVLQRISPSQCWMMTSNQLLAAFTKADLKWLGQFALYTQK